ncbi:MAG TPA: ChbG/HpnK family deacetylase [Candidatus Deferrimicrobiaceae bacterium]|nr:ChbG/HpnK family deacetylase [Candidatus Deferrimicrobiaceae bacterium]
MSKEPPPASLIVNADDFGYSQSVSRGILDAARKGVVTATGVLANSPYFDELAKELLAVGGVDTGVHLNLTGWPPITGRLADLLERSKGVVSGNKNRVALSILTGRIDVSLVEREWDAQILRCLDAGIRVWFLNSHEHLHMLPPLFRLIHRLADRYTIPYIRYPSAEWFGFPKAESLTREVTLQVLDWINRGGSRRPGPVLLGVSRSGKLDLAYLERRLATLRKGGVYELMCHPGYAVTDESFDRRQIAYHDWEGELNSLFRAGDQGLFHSGNVRLIGFRDLEGPLAPQSGRCGGNH